MRTEMNRDTSLDPIADRGIACGGAAEMAGRFGEGIARSRTRARQAASPPTPAITNHSGHGPNAPADPPASIATSKIPMDPAAPATTVPPVAVRRSLVTRFS